MASGSVYKRKGSKYWYIGYPDGRGGQVCESTGTQDRDKADRILRDRLRVVDEGGEVDRDLVDLAFEELRKAVATDYRTNRRKSLSDLERRFALHLGPYFKGIKVNQIGTRDVKAYQAKRLDEGAAPATINREVAALRRGFTLLQEDHPALTIPRCPKLREDNVRQGFVSIVEHDAVQEHLPAEVRGLVAWAFWTGWRKGEVLSLRWAWVDEESGVVRIPDSKNDEGRSIPYAALPVLADVLDRQRDYTREVALRTGQVCPWVWHREGRRIKYLRQAWKDAVKAAGFPKLLFHDLRRSAVVSLERAGVPRSVAMSITGHKTESVYRRYAIADRRAQEEAFNKLNRLKRDGGRNVLPMKREGT